MSARASGGRARAGRLLGADGEPSDERPLRLEELLDRVDGVVPLQLDVKAYADEALALRAVEAVCDVAERRATAGWVEVISFFADACIAAARRGFRARVVTWSDYLAEEMAGWAARHGIAGVSCEGFILVRDLATAVRRAGLSISVGAVNNVDQARKLLPCEPDILVSDRPAELRAGLGR